MPWRQDTMMTPPIEELLDRVDSKFTLVTLAARRARQINSYFNHLGEGLGAIVPPQVASTARKPLSIAFEEIAAGKIVYERTADDTGVEDVEEQLEGDREWGPIGTLSDEVAGEETAGGEAPEPS